jgi:hypothetical protein
VQRRKRELSSDQILPGAMHERALALKLADFGKLIPLRLSAFEMLACDSMAELRNGSNGCDRCVTLCSERMHSIIQVLIFVTEVRSGPGDRVSG